MNGMAQHGGVMPYGGTFLVFSDYSRPAIRLGALQSAKVIHVMTHDSIGLGEDGPTHQPIEHLQSLRAIPQLHVYRPADAVETAECWAAALADDGPSLLALSRQNLRAGADRGGRPRTCRAKGAYRLKRGQGGAQGDPDRHRHRGRDRGRGRRSARRRRGSAPTSSRCPAPTRSTRRTRPIARTSCPTCRTARSCACRSRRGRPSAGSAIPGSTACASASTASAPRPRRPTCTSISA